MAVALVLGLLGAAPPASAQVPVSATLVRSVNAFQWVPPSPDPSGVAYLPDRGTLLVVDSEVDETTGAGHTTTNLWEVTLSGAVVSSGATLAYSDEPTGVGAGPDDTVFIASDDDTAVYVVGPGPDDLYGTGDDDVDTIDMDVHGASDVEDPAYVPSVGHLFVLDGTTTTVFRIDPVDGVFGDEDDVVTSFDVGVHGSDDYEGLTYDANRDTLLVGSRRDDFIAEITLAGELVRIIQVDVGQSRISGLATAPAGDGSGVTNYWIADRRTDNDSDPTENDGMLFEISVPGTGGGPGSPDEPVLVSPSDGGTGIGTSPTLEVTVTDPEEDTLSVEFFGRRLASGVFESIGTDAGIASGGNASVTWASLDEGQAYEWFVRVSDGSNVRDGPVWTFRTAPGSATVFVGAGDIAMCGSNGDERTAAVVAGVDGTVFTTGDNVYENGTAQEFADCYEPSWGAFKGRTRPVPGNHDWGPGVTDNLDGYTGYFGPNATDDDGNSYYSYDLDEDWHVVNLDSECSLVPGGCGVGSPQQQWLLDDLAENQDKNIIAVWHRPRFSTKSGTGSMGPLVDALYEGGVDLALVGHDHVYERLMELDASGQPDPESGFRHFIVGTGGANLHSPEPPIATSEVFEADTFGVLKLTLHEDSYEWDFLPVAGQTFTDSGTEQVDDGGEPPGPNQAPVFNQDLQDRTDPEGATVDLSAGATDPDGDDLTYEATGLPPGISIDPETGQISGTIGPGAAAGSPYEVEVTVRDGPLPPDEPEPIELVQSNSLHGGTGSSFINLDFPDPPTEGNLLVATGFTQSSTPVTMPAGWDHAVTADGTARAFAFYKVAGPGESSTVTVTRADATTGRLALSIFEYSGLLGDQSQVLDQTAIRVLSSGEAANQITIGPTPTTTEANELLLANLSIPAGRTPQNTWTNGFTRQTLVSRHTTADRIVSATGQFETTETWDGEPVGASALMVTFKGASATDTLTATDTFTWTVVPGNAPPVIDSVSIDQTGPDTDDTLTVSVAAHDPEDDPITFDYQWLKNGEDISGATSATLDLSVPGNGDRGDEISVRVVASDGSLPSAPVTSDPVTVVNSPPIFDQDLPDRTDTEGDMVSFSAGASDLDDDTLTYSATGLPPGITIDPGTGEISGTIEPGAAAGGPYNVEVTVRDGPLPSGPIELVQSNGAADSGVTELSVSLPSQPTEGNLLVALGNATAAASTVDLPAGWDVAAVEPSSGGPSFAYFKVAGPSEPSSLTLHRTGGTSGRLEFVLLEYAGVRGDQSDVLDRSVTNTASDVNQMSTGTTEETTVPDELLVAGVSLGATRGFLNTWTNGFAQLYDGSRFTAADRIVSSAGQFETSESWDGTPSGGSALMVTFKGAGGADTLTATDTFTWTVVPGNAPPVVDSVVIDQTAPKTNDTLSVTVNASDPDEDELTFEYQWLKNGVEIEGETSSTLDLSIPGNGDKGDEISVRVTAFDGVDVGAPVTSDPVTVVNSEPVFDQDLGDRTDDEGTFAQIDAGATDPDGDPLIYEATGLPGGVTIDASTGLISGTISFEAAAQCPYSVVVTVRDGPEVDGTDTFTWTVTNVNRAPMLGAIGDQEVDEGGTLDVPVSAVDPDGDTLTFSLGAGTPSWATLTDHEDGTATLSLAPGFEDAGEHELTVFVSDADLTDEETFTVAVTDVNRAPSFDQDLGDRTDPEGAVISIDAGATDPDEDELTYSATGLPPDLMIDPDTGEISGTISFEAAADSPYAVEVTVTDGDLTDTDTFTWTVTNVNRAPMLGAIGDQEVAEGDTLDVPITASDPDDDELTFSLGTGAPTWVSLTDHADGTATLTLEPGFEDEGEYELTAIVSDGDLTDQETFTVLVTGTNQEPTFNQDLGDRTDDEGTFVQIDAGATDPDGDPLTYEATGLPEGVTINPTTGLISGTIAFTAAADSPYPVEVTVRDGLEVDDTDTFTWTINNVNRAPMLGAIGDQEVAEGDTLNVPLTAADPDGDPLTFSLGAGAPAWASLTDHGDGTATLTLSPGFEDEGDHELTVVVSDGDLTDQETFTVEVTGTNQDPTFDQDLGDRTDDEGTFVMIDAGATDPDGDPLTYEATGLPEGVTINPTTGLISGTIAFTAAADSPYPVEVTVRDGLEVDDTDTFTWTINNVNRAPMLLQDLEDRTDPEGAVISIDAGATDPDGDPLTYSATGLPPGLSIDPDTGEISGTIDYDAAPDSPYAVEVTVTDGDLTDSDTFTWTVTESAAPGETVSTGTQATPSDPLVTSVTTPNTGPVEIVEGPVTGDAPAGFSLLGQQADISAPAATANDPLVLVFRLDASILPEGQDETSIQVFRDGELVPACGGAPGVADPDPCVSGRARLGDGDVQITVLTSEASRWTFGVPEPLRVKRLKRVTRNEGDRGKRAMVFRVRLWKPAETMGSVRFRTIQRTAKRGQDFVFRKGRIVFRPGDQVAAIKVFIKGDRIPERNERFVLKLFKPQNVVLAKAQAVGVIIDND